MLWFWGVNELLVVGHMMKLQPSTALQTARMPASKCSCCPPNVICPKVMHLLVITNGNLGLACVVDNKTKVVFGGISTWRRVQLRFWLTVMDLLSSQWIGSSSLAKLNGKAPCMYHRFSHFKKFGVWTLKYLPWLVESKIHLLAWILNV